MSRLTTVSVWIGTTQPGEDTPAFASAVMTERETKALRNKVAKYVEGCVQRRLDEKQKLQTRLSELDAY
jgi:hypothetical protein